MAGSKLIADGSTVLIEDAIVTATFNDCCYVEKAERAWGVRLVDQEGVYPAPGTEGEISGTLRTSPDGERYIEIESVYDTGSGSVAPLGMPNKMLGGADWNHDPGTGEGQRGVTGGVGLNNIGLLVRTTGVCTYVDAHTFTIDDGSGVTVTCVTPPTILASTAWQQVAVTGISSIRRNGDTYERLLRVTSVDSVVSDPPEGITGRWEMVSTSGDACGVFGMLLVQEGSNVSGQMWRGEVQNGRMNGSVFAGTFDIAEYGTTVEFSLTLEADGNTLSGTWTAPDEGTYQMTFHRLSPDPISPYAGRPRVVSASCDGQSIRVVWDRPVSGWDYEIRDENGQSIGWFDGVELLYDPTTYAYTIVLDPATVFAPGRRYTVSLEWRNDGADVDWHDPYGVAAWADFADCYSFEFTYVGDTPPPPPPF